jgi:hypothetical protein
MPTHNRQFLERQLAYKLQEVEVRKVDPGLMERNNKNADLPPRLSEKKGLLVRHGGGRSIWYGLP